MSPFQFTAHVSVPFHSMSLGGGKSTSLNNAVDAAVTAVRERRRERERTREREKERERERRREKERERRRERERERRRERGERERKGEREKERVFFAYCRESVLRLPLETKGRMLAMCHQPVHSSGQSTFTLLYFPSF